MINYKIFFAILGAYIMCHCSYPNYAAAQLTNASQFLNLYGSSTNGQITSFSIILPSGQIQTYQIPSGKALMIQAIKCYFKANSYTSDELSLEIPPYYKNSFRVNQDGVNGVFSVDGWWFLGTVPFAVSNNANLKAQIIDKVTGNVFPGKMEVTLLCYILPLTTGATGPIDLLLGKPQPLTPMSTRIFAGLTPSGHR